MKTLEQELAEKVYHKVVAHEGQPDAKKYGSMAHKLPILIRTAGLAEALAFVESRGKDPLDALLDDLARVVSNQSRKDFVAQSRSADLQDYIYLTRRTMLALKWFKRFAQSMLGVDATEEGDNT
jgi:CRISPR-associated protein Cmr5